MPIHTIIVLRLYFCLTKSNFIGVFQYVPYMITIYFQFGWGLLF